jgi:hypothetical protein
MLKHDESFQELQQLNFLGCLFPPSVGTEKVKPARAYRNDLLPEATALESRGRIEPDELPSGATTQQKIMRI